jgi:O-antigen ligase
MMFFIAATCLHNELISQLKCFVRSPLLVGIALLFFIPFISGMWSSNFQEWLDVIRIKLPLLLLPVAFAGKWQFTGTQWHLLASIFVLTLIIACCWSLYNYAQNTGHFNEAYLRAKTITTPLADDHVRFSWLVSTGVAVALIALHKTSSLYIKLFLSAALILFTVYLHILSVRTGLVSFYTIIFFLFLQLFLSGKQKWTLLIMPLLIIIPIAAWFFVPTFKNRISYMLYDLSFIRNNTYVPGTSDGNRVVSYRAAWNIMKDNFFGVGAGDIREQTNNWYNRNVPSMKETDKLLPSSEWFMYAGFAGWPGIILFTCSMVVPFLLKPRKHKYLWWSLNATAAISFLFDIGLEVQYGVFLYPFIILWLWRWFNEPSEAK